MTEKNCRLSIIIPTYNVENYIEETLNSCLNQDIPKSEYEIICIDDGSKDNTIGKIEQIMKIHNNIYLYTQKNSGVSVARNRGIELANGNYIWFVDSDDLIKENCLKILLEKAEKYDAQKLLFGMEHFTTKLPIHNEDIYFDFCGENEKMNTFTFSHGGGGVCRSLYKNVFLKTHQIIFNKEIAFSEDILFNFNVLINCNKCVKTDSIFYYYRQREGSVMHSKNFNKHIHSMYLLAKEYTIISKKNISEYWKNLAKRKSYFAIKALLFGLVQKGDIKFAREYIEKLKAENLYPYPFLNILFNNKSLKEYIINWISFLLPLKWYFILCVRLSYLKNKILKK